MEERVQALLQEKIRDHIRVLGLTPEGEAEEWAAIAIALASVTSREAAKRKRRVKNPCVVAALSIENARITSAVPMPRKRESKRPR